MDLIWNKPPNKKTNSLYLPSDTNQQYICARRGVGGGGGRVLLIQGLSFSDAAWNLCWIKGSADDGNALVELTKIVHI